MEKSEYIFHVLYRNKKRWRKTNLEVPTIRIFENNAEIQEMIDQDHQREFSNQ